MKQTDWLTMLDYRQSIHYFSRNLLRQSSACTLSTSELEILSLLYLHPQENTPLSLSRQSGMKKEAISRCLRQLCEKDCIARTPNPQDERSVMLALTPNGLEKLNENYAAILSPLYGLQRCMGEKFQTLVSLLEQANQYLDQQNP